MIFKRAFTLAAAFSSGFVLLLVEVGGCIANGQSPPPANGLRPTPERPAETVTPAVRFSIVFNPDHAAKIDFELRSGAISGAVMTDRQLADFAFASHQKEDVAGYLEPGQESELIYDAEVRPATHNDAGAHPAGNNISNVNGGFSAFSNVEVATFDAPVPVDQAPPTGNEQGSAGTIPVPSTPALPQPQSQPQPQLLPQPSLAQTPYGPALPADFALNVPISRQLIGDLLEEIQRQKDLLKTSQDEPDEEHLYRAKTLEDSQKSLLQAKKYLKKDFGQRKGIEAFEDDKKILQEKLAVDRQPQLPQDSASAADLFARLEVLRRAMEDVNSRLNDLNETELQHKVRLGEIPKDRAAARKRITELDKRLKKEELGDADTFLMIRLRAEELELEYRIESLESESKLYELENRLMPLNSDLLAREVKILETEIEAWNFAANQRRRLDLEEEARLARAQVIDAAPALRMLAELNAELTERRIAFSEQVRAATDEKIEVKELLNSVRSQHENVETSIIDSTLSQANGMLLVDIRRTMVRPFKSQQRIRAINRELQKISIERIELNEQREPLSHPVQYAAKMVEGVHSDAISDEKLSVMALEIVESIRQQYDQLSADHHTYTDLLGKIVAEREELVHEIEATLQFVNEKSLWVRSAQPIGVQQLTKSRYAVAKFFSPAKWTQLLGELTHRCFTSPHESAAGLIGLVGLFVFSRRFKA